jgi:hypothetical protein
LREREEIEEDFLIEKALGLIKVLLVVLVRTSEESVFG